MKFFKVFEMIHVARLATHLFKYTQDTKDPSTIQIRDIRIMMFYDKQKFNEPDAEELTNIIVWSPKREKEIIE